MVRVSKLTFYPYARPRPLPSPYNHYASVLSPPPYLVCYQPIPHAHGILSLLQLHAACLVHYRGHTLQLLCLELAREWRPGIRGVAKI